ncbi:putative sugar phosphate exchanger 2 [Apostichopus japonicus]|uniref:Putative sugar phosphate exchanger 2 n=1 Tax=Stichopus japonicus TaxID=307972 RepID=A0A2G8KQR2_STIJA|nr:putative sugar phosphate exchanger 2 [Apostichopus japonicus]
MLWRTQVIKDSEAIEDSEVIEVKKLYWSGNIRCHVQSDMCQWFTINSMWSPTAVRTNLKKLSSEPPISIPDPSDVGCQPPVQERQGAGNQEQTLDLSQQPPITFCGALLIPGVIEFSLCLFFAKLVSYSFLFWLPFYLLNNLPNVGDRQAAYLSTLFDIGGIFGGILAGYLADVTGSSGIISFLTLCLAAPVVFLYNFFGRTSYIVNIVLMVITGFFVNGPYALITTAVSADLGTHESLHGNAKALSTVTAIIDGTGTIGAAWTSTNRTYLTDQRSRLDLCIPNACWC